jgi:hypothetical protein
VILRALALLWLAAAGCSGPSQRACSPSMACASDDKCVWLVNDGRGYCAPACGDGGACPSGLACRQVAPGECYPCRVYSEACIAP